MRNLLIMGEGNKRISKPKKRAKRYPPEGTREILLNHRDGDWSTNGHVYRFAPIVSHEVKVSAEKHPNGTIVVDASGPFGRRFKFRFPMPACDSHGLHLVIAWEHQEIKFYLNAELVRAFTLP